MLLSFICHSLFSQDLNLSIFTIPDSLKKDANAIFRYHHTNIEMLSSSKMTIKKDVAVTIYQSSYFGVQLDKKIIFKVI